MIPFLDLKAVNAQYTDDSYTQSLVSDINELIKMLTSIIKTTQEKKEE